MSYIPGDKSEDPQVHFKAGIKDVIRFDKVRLINIIGSIQYGISYIIAFFIVGITVNYVFPSFTTTSDQSLFNLFLWILIQSLIIIIIIFYIKKIIEAIPGIPSFFPEYFDYTKLLAQGFIPYGIAEFQGNMATNIILIGTQVNLLKKVSYFTTEFSKRYL
jgi:hypothetical protein